MERKRVRVFVSGKVQGVFFRQSCFEESKRLGVNGWVKNLSDGRVEAVFEASSPLVDRMVAWCEHGPKMANVTLIHTKEEESAFLSDFQILT